MITKRKLKKKVTSREKLTLKGASLAGTSSTRERVVNDYYATPPESTKALLDKESFKGSILEPCVGGGHIAEILKTTYPKATIDCYDLVDRGYPNTQVKDFLNLVTTKKYDNVITNPPYSLAQEFLEKSFEVLKPKGKIAMFLKIQFLEGSKRKELFKKYPPKIIYVFSKRQNPWRNGNPLNEQGKPWSSTICFAWFLWEEGSTSEPIIRWI